MDEKSKKFLYTELVEMYNNEFNIIENKKELISEDEFLRLSDVEALRYFFDYRNNYTFFEINGEKSRCCVDIPDMNLEGQDLTGIEFSDFRLGIIDSESYVIESQSSVNLKNTHATINVSRIEPNNVIEEKGRRYYALDFNNTNFQGCNVYGILPDEYEQKKSKGIVKVIGKEETFDEKYLQRREENHLEKNDKLIADKAYERLINGESLKGLNGVGGENNRKRINLTDYDFSEINQDEKIYQNFKDTLSDYYIDLVDGKGKELIQNIILEKIAKKDFNWLKQNFGRLSPGLRLDLLSKSNVFKNFLDKKNIKFIPFEQIEKEHKDYILEKLKEGDLDYVSNAFRNLSESDMKDIVMSGYYEGYYDFFRKYFYKLDSQQKEDVIIKEYYENDNFPFIMEQFDELNTEQKKDVIRLEYKKGNYEFLTKIMALPSSKHGLGSVIATIMYSEYEKGNYEFVTNNMHFLNPDERRYIIELGLCNGNYDFVANNLDCPMSNKYSESKEYIDNCRNKIKIEKLKEKEIEIYKNNIELITIGTSPNKIKGFCLTDNILFYLSHNQQITIDSNEISRGFINTFFHNIITSQELEIEKEHEKGNIAFLEQVIKYMPQEKIPTTIVSTVIEKELEEENYYLLRNNIDLLPPEQQLQFINYVIEKGNNKKIDLFFDNLKIRDIIELEANDELKGKYVTRKYLLNEKNKMEYHGNKRNSCEGKLLFNELSKEKIDRNVVLSLIKEGSGLEYVCYNKDENSEKIINSLYVALTNISDEKDRKDIVGAMLNAGAKYEFLNNVSSDGQRIYDEKLIKEVEEIIENEKNEKITETAKTVEINESDKIIEPSEKEELVQNGEIEKSIKENEEDKNKNNTTPDNKTEIEKTVEINESDKITEPNQKVESDKTNKENNQSGRVYNFLVKQIGLSDKEVKALAELFKNYNRDIFLENLENNLELKKKILDLCNATKQGFTKDATILFLSPQSLYARLKFFNKYGIVIDSNDINATLGITNKRFARKYGMIVSDRENMDEMEYARLVQRKLASSYPMPKSRNEFDKEIDSLIVKGRGVL